VFLCIDIYYVLYTRLLLSMCTLV